MRGLVDSVAEVAVSGIGPGRQPAKRPFGLKPVFGFEATAFAWRGADLVWCGHSDGRPERSRHPRHASSPWRAAPRRYLPERLQAGARMLATWLCGPVSSASAQTGLLRWLRGEDLAFPFAPAAPRFDAVRKALRAGDAPALQTAALQVLGLGPGLTPSGDDFLGGLFFALHHAPEAWTGQPAQLTAIREALLAACPQATNPISAALLSDLMAGQSYSLVHELLDALHDGSPPRMQNATLALLALGASSGADLLAGLLTALCVTDAPLAATNTFVS